MMRHSAHSPIGKSASYPVEKIKTMAQGESSNAINGKTFSDSGRVIFSHLLYQLSYLGTREKAKSYKTIEQYLSSIKITLRHSMAIAPFARVGMAAFAEVSGAPWAVNYGALV